MYLKHDRGAEPFMDFKNLNKLFNLERSHDILMHIDDSSLYICVCISVVCVDEAGFPV